MARLAPSRSAAATSPYEIDIGNDGAFWQARPYQKTKRWVRLKEGIWTVELCSGNIEHDEIARRIMKTVETASDANFHPETQIIPP